MAWTKADSRARLRNLLSDGDTDKLAHRKALLGQQNGTNVSFKTQETRRLTDFSDPGTVLPLGVYLNGGLVSGITADDVVVGQFEMPAAPTPTDTLEATYYYQWFSDDMLDGFMQDAIDWLASGPVETFVDGLKTAALNYAVGRAYEKLALMWAQNQSLTFRLEDAPDPKTRTPAQEYTSLAKYFRKVATDDRNDYYTRQGRSLSPAFATIVGCVPNPVPNQ